MSERDIFETRESILATVPQEFHAYLLGRVEPPWAYVDERDTLADLRDSASSLRGAITEFAERIKRETVTELHLRDLEIQDLD